jgi:hypothetical protein
LERTSTDRCTTDDQLAKLFFLLNDRNREFGSANARFEAAPPNTRNWSTVTIC